MKALKFLEIRSRQEGSHLGTLKQEYEIFQSKLGIKGIKKVPELSKYQVVLKGEINKTEQLGKDWCSQQMVTISEEEEFHLMEFIAIIDEFECEAISVTGTSSYGVTLVVSPDKGEVRVVNRGKGNKKLQTLADYLDRRNNRWMYLDVKLLKQLKDRLSLGIEG